MKHKYLSNVATLKLYEEKCVGCGRCTEVCPHNVFHIHDRKASIIDLDSCMECGACAKNCPARAIEVTPVTGCVYAVIKSWKNKLLGRPDTGEC